MNNFYKCRLCLKSCRNKIDVFKDDFPKMIEILTGLKIDPYDEFPRISCLDCAKNVKAALRIRKQIIHSHKRLLEEFLSKCRELETFIVANTNQKNINEAVNQRVDSSMTNKTEKRPQRYKVRKNKQKVPETLQTKISTDDLTTKSHSIISSELDTKIGVPDQEADSPCDDKNTLDLSSPLSDTGSDVDWEPDDRHQNKPSELIKGDLKTKTCPPTKVSDGEVSFVRKNKYNTAKNAESQKTVVRIKKKPKGRIKPKRVTCDICKREVQSYWLQKHMETHEYNPVTCEFCGLVSKSATALRHHVFYYHRSTADEYMCDQCGKNFRSKYRLNLHKKKEHGGTKDFECTTCGKKFFERMHLKRHVDKTHKNIRPYICDFCGKGFKSKNHIKIHERIHSKEAPYSCHMCGESFKMKLTLKTHLKGVHNVQEEEKVFCDICKRGFASDIALKAHLNSRIHETEKCQHCSEMFTREYMINHLRDSHRLTSTTF